MSNSIDSTQYVTMDREHYTALSKNEKCENIFSSIANWKSLISHCILDREIRSFVCSVTYSISIIIVQHLHSMVYSFARSRTSKNRY